jgi:hypothetical protein
MSTVETLTEAKPKSLCNIIRMNSSKYHRTEQIFYTYVNRQRYSNDLFRPPFLSLSVKSDASPSMFLDINARGISHPKRA